MQYAVIVLLWYKIAHSAIFLLILFSAGAGMNLYKQQKESSSFDDHSFRCTPSGIRTLDPLIKSQLLYQLS